MKKENQVAKAETTAVATSAPPQAPSGILPSDVIIPRLLLMQGTSDFVKDRIKTPSGATIQLGDMVKSTTKEVLGNPEQPLEFIPLAEPAPTWINECKPVGGNRYEFRGIEPRTAKNDTLPWNYIADKDKREVPAGTPGALEWRRVKCLSLFALLPSDIKAYAEEMKKAEAGEMPDLSKALTPILITFRSTGFNAGKEVVTFFSQAQQFNQPAWKYKLQLGNFLDKNDQGTFYVFKVDRAKPAPVAKEDLQHVQYWANIVATTTLRVDETDEGSSASEQGGAGGGNF